MPEAVHVYKRPVCQNLVLFQIQIQFIELGLKSKN